MDLTEGWIFLTLGIFAVSVSNAFILRHVPLSAVSVHLLSVKRETSSKYYTVEYLFAVAVTTNIDEHVPLSADT